MNKNTISATDWILEQLTKIPSWLAPYITTTLMFSIFAYVGYSTCVEISKLGHVQCATETWDDWGVQYITIILFLIVIQSVWKILNNVQISSTLTLRGTSNENSKATTKDAPYSYNSDIRTSSELSSPRGSISVGQLEILISELIEQRAKSEKTAYVNLVLGLAFAMITAILLYNIAFQDSSIELLKLTSRSLLAITLTSFSFFFLQLYRNGMQDRKYYQNEISNFRTKLHAFTESSSSEEPPEIKKTLLSELMATERNFVLKKGESTATTQINQVDFGALAKLLKAIKE